MSTPRTLVGMGVSPGIAIGRPVVVENRPMPVLRVPVPEEGLDAEVARLHEAARTAAVHMADIIDDTASRMGGEYRSILEAHQLLLEDPTLLREVEDVIRTRSVNAEWALEHVISKLVAQFERLGDVYLSERRTDLIDVGAQLQRELQGRSRPNLERMEAGSVLVGDDIPPAQAIQFAGAAFGFATETGGKTSHTTIIAKSLGIPAVVGVAGLVEAARRADLVIVDGFEGHVLVSPDPALVQVYRLRAEEHRRRQEELLGLAQYPAETLDGRRITLLANVDLLHELPAAVAGGAEGIGLFRSEFIYLQASPDLPDEAEQSEAYAAVLAAFADKPVAIRTFDLGGKKLARDVIGNPESNPVLGLRGVRLCLQRPDFFRTQLRALLRAAGGNGSNLRVMVPLVSHIEEIRTVRVLLRRFAEEVRSEGYAVPERLAVGAMIEVPSAALVAEHLAQEVDFFAIGTNDLTQYTLAVDRANEQVADLYRPFHPAVLRLVERVITAGRRAGVPVSLCGEMAADPLAVPVLVGLGLEEFSMHPPALPVVRNLIRSLSYREARKIAQRALAMATAKEVEEYLLERLSGLMAHLKVRIRL